MNSRDLRDLTWLTLSMYGSAATRATVSLAKNPAVLAGSLLLVVISHFGMSLLFSLPLGFAGGLLAGLLHAYCLSLFYRWLAELSSGQSVTWRDLFHPFDSGIFIAIINVGFILWVVSFGLQVVAQGNVPPIITLGLNLFILFFFNALPEAIYIGKSEGMGSFSVAGEFIRQNWLEWYLPFLLFLFPVLILTLGWQWPILEVAQSSPLLPMINLVQMALRLFLVQGVSLGVGNAPVTLVSALLTSFLSALGVVWFMLFRGFLFRGLHASSRRSRLFKARS